MTTAFIIVGAISLASFLIWAIRSGLRSSRKLNAFRVLIEETENSDIKADAVVIKMRKIGTRSTYCYVKWDLEVTPPLEAKYMVTEYCLAPPDNTIVSFRLDTPYVSHFAKEGAVVPVLIHPVRKEVIQIDKSRLLEYMQRDH